MKTHLGVLLGVLVAATLAACAEGERPALVEVGKEGEPCRGGLAEFLEVRRVVYDYEPAKSPSDLARQADAVVTGTIVGVKPGRDSTTSVLEVEVDQLVGGERALVSDGFLYIKVGHTLFGRRAPFDHADFAAVVPRAFGVFFVDQPDARAKLTSTYVQGFLIENACGKLVSLWDSFRSMAPAWRRLDSVEEVVAQLR